MKIEIKKVGSEPVTCSNLYASLVDVEGYLNGKCFLGLAIFLNLFEIGIIVNTIIIIIIR